MESDGKTTLYPGGDFAMYCNFDLTYFPFDEQHCIIKIGAWSSNSEVEILKAREKGVYLGNISHEQWQIINATMQNVHIQYTGNSYYSEIRFDLHLKRKAGYYLMYIFFPSIIFSMVTSVTFIVPPEVDNRLALSFTALLAQSVFQSMVGNDMPKSSDNLPLLSLYLFLMDFYIFVAIALQSFAVYFAKSNPKTMPNFLKVTFIKRNSTNSEEFLKLANNLDRISCVIYLFLVIATPITLLIVIPVFE